MSADNYYRICKHPRGGYTAVMRFMSNDERPEPRDSDPQFRTWQEAYEYADKDTIIEYGIQVDPDCTDTGAAGQVTITVHEVAIDGLPDMDVLVGRVAFIFDGSIVSGWPMTDDDDVYGYDGQLWEGDTDVSHGRPFGSVTHWIEFPRPVWELVRRGETKR